MYLRITSRCNMTCAHCGFSCTARGQDMTRETFLEALAIGEGDYSLTIGGGEPTVHPLLFDFLGLALAYGYAEEDYRPMVITNGKNTEAALALARMARHGVIRAELSLDKWHEPVDKEVIHAFTKNPNRSNIGSTYGVSDTDFRGIRTVQNIVDIGRAKKNGLGTDDDCICPDLIVQPNGDLYACGCMKVRCGTVWKMHLPKDYVFGECYSEVRMTVAT